MMRKAVILCAAAFGALAAAYPLASVLYIPVSTVGGGTLAAQCRQGEDVVLDICVGYVLGVADRLQLERATCRPASDAGTLQTVAIVRRYLKDRPEEWGEHGVVLVQRALQAAFPCTGSQ